MTKNEAVQKQIDEIMDFFDFGAVRAQMIHEEWKWNGEDSAPEEWELRRAARERLNEAAECGYSATGGFAAIRNTGGDGINKWIRLGLYFGHSWENDEGTSYTE